MAIKKRKILYISGTRADYGLMKETLLAIQNSLLLKLEIIVTGMHLMSQFGNTINEVKKDKFIIHKANVTYENDDKESTANFIGKFVQQLIGKIEKIKPDIILVLGDRAEMLAGALVGAYLAIPVAHIHGGDISGTVDDIARHTITKLSHIHFPATKKSAERIIKMGEESSRVHIVGSPGIDNILNFNLPSSEVIAKRYKLDLLKPILIVVQHPAEIEVKETKENMEETMLSVKELGYQTIVIYPNADAGGREIIKVIEKYRKYPFIRIYKNISRIDYLGLLKISSVMIGNSSSGIIEAPFFHLPVVNIGSRQTGRERADNIIDVDYKKMDIKKAVQKSLFDKKFKEQVKKCKNPYGGDIKTGHQITKVLSEIKIEDKLLQKKLSY